MSTPPLPDWLKITARGDLQLTIHVQPGAKTTTCAGLYGDCLKIRLAAPPVDGKANQALMAWLAKTLKVPQRAITLIRGDTSRRKTLQIAAIPPEAPAFANASALAQQLQTLAQAAALER